MGKKKKKLRATVKKAIKSMGPMSRKKLRSTSTTRKSFTGRFVSRTQ